MNKYKCVIRKDIKQSECSIANIELYAGKTVILEKNKMGSGYDGRLPKSNVLYNWWWHPSWLSSVEKIR